MGKLSDILASGNGGNIHDLWNSTTAADDFSPLPAGSYVCRLISGELGQARTGTPQYTLSFQVLSGDFKRRQIWHSLFLTPAALPLTKRDLAKLGVTALEQLEQPVPKGIRCKVGVVLHRDDDGTERNRIRTFSVLGIDPPELDPFAPDVSESNSALNAAETDTGEAEGATESTDNADRF